MTPDRDSAAQDEAQKLGRYTFEPIGFVVGVILIVAPLLLTDNPRWFAICVAAWGGIRVGLSFYRRDRP